MPTQHDDEGEIRDAARRAFRRLAKDMHPDAAGDAESFRALTQAYSMLCHAITEDRRTRAATTAPRRQVSFSRTAVKPRGRERRYGPRLPKVALPR